MKTIKNNILNILKNQPETAFHTAKSLSSMLQIPADMAEELIEQMEDNGLIARKVIHGRLRLVLAENTPVSPESPAPSEPEKVPTKQLAEPEKKHANKVRTPLTQGERERRVSAITEALTDRPHSQAELSNKCNIPYGSMDRILNSNPLFCRVADDHLLWQLAESCTAPAKPVYDVCPADMAPAIPKTASIYKQNDRAARIGIFDDGTIEIHKNSTVTTLTASESTRLARLLENAGR